jgi:hypothetical protein
MHREGQQSTIRFRKSYSTLGTSVSPHCLEISCKHHHPHAARENQLQQFAKGCQSAACLSVPRESGLELTHCSSPPPANPLLQDKSTFIGSSKTKPPRLSEVYEGCYCIHGTLPLCAASAEWSCTVFDVQGPLFQTARSGVGCMPGRCGVPLNHALPINARTAALQGRRVIDPSPPSKDASPSIQSTLRNTSHHRTVGGKINDSTSSHLAPSTPFIFRASCSC